MQIVTKGFDYSLQSIEKEVADLYAMLNSTSKTFSPNSSDSKLRISKALTFEQLLGPITIRHFIKEEESKSFLTLLSKSFETFKL